MASDRPDQSETEQENADQNDLQQIADLKIQEVSPELMIKHPLQVCDLYRLHFSVIFTTWPTLNK